MPILKTSLQQHREDPEEFCSVEFNMGIPYPSEIIEEEEVIGEKTPRQFWNALLKISRWGK